MIKIEKTNTGENWIASIGRYHTTVKEDQIADLVVAKRMISGKEKQVIVVASDDEAAKTDLQSAVNVITSGKFPTITGVTVDEGAISIKMPVEKPVVEKSEKA